MQTTSVVLCTHNGERYLKQQLDSLRQQSSPPMEIIVSDDASSDSTRAIIADFARTSLVPVHLLHNDPALGFADNFLAAATHATGDWIAFCDQDDIWRADKIATCEAHYGDSVTMIVHRARLIDEHGLAIGDFDQNISTTTQVGPRQYDLWGTFWGFSIVFRRSILRLHDYRSRFEDYIYQNGKLIAHDRWVCFLAQLSGNIVELADRLVDYRQHGRNVAGAGHSFRKEKRTAKVIPEILFYLRVTEQMRHIVDEMPQSTQDLPSFDHAASLLLVDANLAQLEARYGIYQRGRIAGLLEIGRVTVAGRYRSPATGRVRWRSILRDIQICLSGQ